MVASLIRETATKIVAMAPMNIKLETLELVATDGIERPKPAFVN